MLSINGYQLLAEEIKNRSAIDYEKNLDVLEKKIKNRLESLCMDVFEYIRYIKNSPKEWDELVQCITINETYFFREEKHFEELVEIVKERYREGIHIWSAASSTGEEPYSIASILYELNKIPLNKIKIFATDIDKKVLGIAQDGKYSLNSLSFRRTNSEQKEKYFNKNGNFLEVKEEIKSIVKFMHHNLKDIQAPFPDESVDIIFCRNVLFYFGSEDIKKIISKFHRVLKPNGLLFLGHADSISNMGLNFKVINSNSTFYYQKEN